MPVRFNFGRLVLKWFVTALKREAIQYYTEDTNNSLVTTFEGY